MTTNHTYALHGLWSSSSLRTNMSVCLNFIPDTRKHQYKFITKEDQETGIGKNKKKKSIYSQVMNV